MFLYFCCCSYALTIDLAAQLDQDRANGQSCTFSLPKVAILIYGWWKADCVHECMSCRMLYYPLHISNRLTEC